MVPIDAAQFERARREGARIYDTRPAAQRLRAPLPGATPLVLEQVQRGELPDAPRDEPVLLACERGLISELVGLYLEAEGFREVRNLVGGLRAWRALEASPPGGA